MRLSQTDVRNFAERGFVEETLQIDRATGQKLTYKLQRDERAEQLTASFENNCLSIYMPTAMAIAWARSDQVGVEAPGMSDGPSILVEKDFACLKPRAGDEDTDSFPNPEANSHC